MDRPDLKALVADLARRLRLQDWRIDIEYTPDLCAPDGAPVYGLCWPNVDARQARIRVRDPQTPYGPDDPPVRNTVIHELIHLHFAPLAGSTQAEIIAEEQAVWAIADALEPTEPAVTRESVRTLAASTPQHIRQSRAIMPRDYNAEINQALAQANAALGITPPAAPRRPAPARHPEPLSREEFDAYRAYEAERAARAGGGARAGRGLPEAERRQLAERMGIRDKTAPAGPHYLPDGRFALSVCPPAETAAQLARFQRAQRAAGKA